MIIGNKYRSQKVLKPQEELELLQGVENAKISVALYERLKNSVHIDLQQGTLFKEEQILNTPLKIGDRLRINRWDENGNPDFEIITNIIPLDENSCKIETLKGSVIFSNKDKEYGEFIWNELQKDSWTRKNMNYVNFKYLFIEI